LIVAPHMDDESLGCGGLMAKYPDECTVVVVTDSGEVRAQEHRKALDVLGVGPSRCLQMVDGETQGHMPELVARLDELFAEVRPEEVYLPFPSLHQDHIATYEAGMRACRISMSADHWVPPSVLVYDIAVYDVNLYPSDLRWNVFEALTETQAEQKTAACAAYRSEIPTGSHPMNSVKELAASVGHIRLVDYAEQYALVRQVRR
jgi:LmbE family N-acetylglucosaminyl deacetylase